MRGRPQSESEAEAPEDLRSRGDARREQKREEERLMKLATALTELPERQLGKLELPETVLDAVLDARQVRDPAPRHRALRLVRIALRDADPTLLERRLRDVNEPARPGAVPKAAPTWSERLLEGGDGALDALVADHPEADRKQLRQLVRNVKAAAEAKRPAARKALDSALVRYRTRETS